MEGAGFYFVAFIDLLDSGQSSRSVTPRLFWIERLFFVLGVEFVDRRLGHSRASRRGPPTGANTRLEDRVPAAGTAVFVDFLNGDA